MTQLTAILPFAHALLSGCLKHGDTALDGTMGNGHDTQLLAQLVGDTGRVYAFDIQKQAIENTKQRLQNQQLDHRVQLIHAGHQHMTDYIQENINAAVFNFGYLPRGDHAICTQPETSIQAIQAACDLLKPHGIIVLVLYHGHDVGKLESQAIVQFVRQLPQTQFRVLRYEFINQINNPPYIIAIEKIAKQAA